MTTPLEFSRPFNLARLGSGQERHRLTAEAAECEAVADRLGLDGLHSLTAEVTVTAEPASQTLAISGWLEADVTRTCVVTLKPFRHQLHEPLAQRYSLTAEAEAEGEVADIDPEQPDPLPDEGLDLGEEVVQHLSLALDPYPRAPDAQLPVAAQDPAAKPFAALSAWKAKPS
ncbi:MAG: YceD family protein [Pseudomonadota bacterium]